MPKAQLFAVAWKPAKYEFEMQVVCAANWQAAFEAATGINLLKRFPHYALWEIKTCNITAELFPFRILENIPADWSNILCWTNLRCPQPHFLFHVLQAHEPLRCTAEADLIRGAFNADRLLEIRSPDGVLDTTSLHWRAIRQISQRQRAYIHQTATN